MQTDHDLLANVTDELRREPSLDEKDIGVAVKDGVVTLTGRVPSYAQRFAVEHAVERVSGVRALANELDVRLPSAKERSDTDVALAAANALQWDTEVPDDTVKVTVVNGWVTLEGHVEWNFQKAAAERAVRFLTGVKGVTNLIALTPRVSPTDVMERIGEALTRSAGLDAKRITVDVQGNTVTLRGIVHSWSERTEAERAAWSVSGVTEVEDQIVIES